MQLKCIKKICAVCGEGAVSDQTCRKWFVKFCAGDFSLVGASCQVDQMKYTAINSKQ